MLFRYVSSITSICSVAIRSRSQNRSPAASYGPSEAPSTPPLKPVFCFIASETPAPTTVIPWARTETFPPMGRTVGGKGTVSIPSARTFRVWKAFAVVAAVTLDCSLETKSQWSDSSITVENAAPVVSGHFPYTPHFWVLSRYRPACLTIHTTPEDQLRAP